jgi:predicted AAA+ superfamily ATPase
MWVHFLRSGRALFFYTSSSSFILSQCALDAFGGRKTFLAVKGCYERNFVVFKQIYAFETFTSGMQQADVDSDSEVDRLREYERRIYAARKAGFHVGNLSSRILDHWHRMGWYATFHSR